MSHVRIKLESSVQERVLEELRQKIARDFGVTLIGPYLTLRWTMDGKHRQASFIATDVSSGEYVQGYWECAVAKPKVCAYDHDADPAHDSCIYCGQPEERK